MERNYLVETICSLEAEIRIKTVQKQVLMERLNLSPKEALYCKIGYIEGGKIHLSNLINIRVLNTHIEGKNYATTAKQL